MLTEKIIEVIIPISIEKTFYYVSNENIQIGHIVYVPFGKYYYYGLVISINCANQKYKLKNSKSTGLLIDQENIDFIKQVSHITLSSLGEIWKMFWIQQVKYNQEKYLYDIEFQPVNLTIEQQIAAMKISQAQHAILYGKTGSGKSEVYLSIINQPGQYLILVPEIALIYELLNKARKRLNIPVHSWSSKSTKGYKSYIWNQIIQRKDMVIIGTRSSLFLPFCNLKTIIVDEEHDISYKQDHGVMYQARDLALYRCKHVILSSATPSIESLLSAPETILLNNRYNDNYAKIKICKPDNKIINQQILDKVSTNFQHKLQSIIFINRKGAAHIMQCSCGKILQCQFCDTNMIYYLNNTAVCHHCLSVKHNPKACHEWMMKKYGMEIISDEILKAIPKARTVIINSDTKQLDRILEDIHNHKIDIIICTQILSKGHNFKHLSFVGILDFDIQRMIDPRSIERSYQLIQQISGRVGRGKLTGEVYIESESSISNLFDEQFLQNELSFRKKHNMIPFRKVISIIILSTKHQVPEIDFNHIKNIKIYGPIEAPINKIKQQYRYRMLIEYNNVNDVQFLRAFRSKNFILDSSPYYFY